MRTILLAAVATIGLAASASAAPIINFGQVSNSNTITATASSTGTTITGTNVGVTITQIDNSSALPGTFPAAFLDLSATSLIGGATVVGGAVVEHFSGMFTVTSGINDTGTNYLSGTFSDAAITAIGATQISIAAPTTTFTSGVISVLGLPRAVGFTLTNVTPVVSLVGASAAPPRARPSPGSPPR